MSWAVIWQMNDPYLGNEKVIAHPEVIDSTDTREQAMTEGRQTLLELAEEGYGDQFKVVAVVEMREDMVDPLRELPIIPAGDLIFVSVENQPFWRSQPWWNN